MTILFKDGEAAWLNPTFLSDAARMVFAFGLLSIGAMFWVARPYLKAYSTAMKSIEKSLITS
jgi:hypothetical protein